MTNVTVQEALKQAIEALEDAGTHTVFSYEATINECKAALAELEKCEPVAWMDETNRTCNALSKKCSIGFADGLFDTYNIPLYTSQQPRECEPVAEAIRERDRLGFAVVNVIGKLDEIIENTQEVEVDDFLHIAVPVDMWNELQAELEYMPKRADLYTSPQPRDWVGLSKQDVKAILLYTATSSNEDFINAVSAKLKQLNTKG